MPNASSCKCSICSMAGHGFWYRRLRRCSDEQQHRCAICLWWFNDRYIYLYKHLCAAYDDLPSRFHGIRSAAGQYRMPSANHRGRLPDASCCECTICSLVGHFQWPRWLQPFRIGRWRRASTICLRRLKDSDLYPHQQLCAIHHQLPVNLYRAGRTDRGAHLPDQHHRSSLPNSSSREHSICHLARNGLGQRRLQRRLDEQQHGSAFCLRRQYDRNLHLYQQLCAIDHYLPGNLHRGRSAYCDSVMPSEYCDCSLPNTGSSELGLRHLVGLSLGQRGLQRCSDEQQHGCSACLWRLYDRYLHLHQQLCSADHHLSSHLHRSFIASGTHLPDE